MSRDEALRRHVRDEFRIKEHELSRGRWAMSREEAFRARWKPRLNSEYDMRDNRPLTHPATARYIRQAWVEWNAALDHAVEVLEEEADAFIKADWGNDRSCGLALREAAAKLKEE